MYNVKLVNSLQKKIQQVLSHGSQLEGKFVVLEYDVIKRWLSILS